MSTKPALFSLSVCSLLSLSLRQLWLFTGLSAQTQLWPLITVSQG